LRGLDSLRPFSESAHAARKAGMWSMRRLIVVVDDSLEDWLHENFVEQGATGYTSLPCRGAGRRELRDYGKAINSKVRIEVVATDQTCANILNFLKQDVVPHHRITTYLDIVDVMRPDAFEALPDSTETEESAALAHS